MQRFMKMAALLALVAVAGCGGGYDSTSPGGTNNGGGGGGGGGTGGGNNTPNAVTVGDDFFNPSSTTVAVGTTVTWTWSTGTLHNVTFDDGQTSGNMSGGTFTRTFNTAGTFGYLCTIHASEGMTGTIIVQ